MKSILLTVLFAAISATANAGVLDVEVEKGSNLVEITWTFWATGCSGSENPMPVIYSEDLDAYVTGRNIFFVKPEISDLENLKRPPMLCQAEVPHRNVAKFLVSSDYSRTIQVVIPNNPLLGAMEVKVETTQNGGLTID